MHANKQESVCYTQEKKKLIEIVPEKSSSLELVETLFKYSQKAKGNHIQRTKANHKNDTSPNREDQ